MKKILLLAAVIGTAICITAAREARKQAEDMFQLMGISKEEAHILMRENLLYVSLSTPSVQKLRQVPAGQRAAVVRELGNYMKQYFKSREVAEAYREYRLSIMPGRQEGIDVKARIAEVKEEISRTEADKRSAPADMKALYETTLTELRKQLKALEDPSHPDHAMYTGVVELSPEQKAEIARQVKEFSKDYPEDLQHYLKLKLEEFVELTSDIDFNARLVKVGGRMKFEDPALEARDYNWKKCFRAGKEVVEAARAFSQQWLKEIR